MRDPTLTPAVGRALSSFMVTQDARAASRGPVTPHPLEDATPAQAAPARDDLPSAALARDPDAAPTSEHAMPAAISPVAGGWAVGSRVFVRGGGHSFVAAAAIVTATSMVELPPTTGQQLVATVIFEETGETEAGVTVDRILSVLRDGAAAGVSAAAATELPTVAVRVTLLLSLLPACAPRKCLPWGRWAPTTICCSGLAAPPPKDGGLLPHHTMHHH
jgi:hypothetical protein